LVRIAARTFSRSPLITACHTSHIMPRGESFGGPSAIGGGARFGARRGGGPLIKHNSGGGGGGDHQHQDDGDEDRSALPSSPAPARRAARAKAS
jgi:hypothetical protein